MTRKRHPAGASRVIAGGVSTAAALALTAGFGLAAPPSDQSLDAPPVARDASAARRPVRVVVEDDRIGAQEAVAAAQRALRNGKHEAYVKVEPLPPLIRYVTVGAPAPAAPAVYAADSSAPAPAPAPVVAAAPAPPPLPAPSAPHTATSSS